MKKMIIFCLSIIALNILQAKEITFQSLIEDWDNSSIKQKEKLYRVFLHAKKDNLSYSASAIAWEESANGLFEIQASKNRNGSWDCGLFGNNTNTVLDNLGLRRTVYNRRMICTKLIKDEEFSYNQFVKQIDYGKRLHGKSWRKIWGSYNSGAHPNMNYGKRIAIRIKVIKHIMKQSDARIYMHIYKLKKLKLQD